MAHPRDARATARRTRQTEQRARISWRASAPFISLLERDRHRERGADRRVDAVPGAAKSTLSCPTPGGAAADLNIARGLCSRALVLVCAENHGGAKRLLRVRCTMRLSSSALFLLRGYALLTALALLLGWPVAAGVLGIGGLVNVTVMGAKLAGFAQPDAPHHRSCCQARGLIPVAPKTERPAPIAAVRTA